MVKKKNFSDNSKSTDFVNSLPESTIETSKIEKRCKFNLSYLMARRLQGKTSQDGVTIVATPL